MKMSSVIFGILMLGFSAAHAAEGPLWACELDANLSGKERGLVISTQLLKGEGILDCVTVDGSREKQIPVNVKIQGTGVGIGYSKVRNVRLVSMGLGIVNDPAAFADKYNLGVSAGASLLRVGIQADAAFAGHSKTKGAGFELGLIGKDVRGIGAFLHGTFMRIEMK